MNYFSGFVLTVIKVDFNSKNTNIISELSVQT